ncbi:MAG: hypothetical protein ACMXX7_02805 [Candidatus Woesearchaeota archaeon]
MKFEDMFLELKDLSDKIESVEDLDLKVEYYEKIKDLSLKCKKYLESKKNILEL